MKQKCFCIFIIIYLLTSIMVAQDGALDPTFGTGGIVTTPIGSSTDYGRCIVVQADGKIIISGDSHNGSNLDVAIVRYHSNGTLDPTFGTGGKVTTPIGPGNDFGQSLAIQSDGKIVVAGESNNGTNNDFSIVRYNSNGTLDTSFDSDGIVITPIGPGTDQGRDVVIQPDGKIVVAGQYHNGTDNDFAVVRYNSNGTLDTSFDSDGIVTTPIGADWDNGTSVALQPNGKIVVAGYSFSSNNANNNFALVRYNTNGTLDQSFGAGGKVTTPIGSGPSFGFEVVVSNGKIIVAGYSSISTDTDFAVVRYNSNGTLDTSFDSDGIVTTPIGASSYIGNSVAVQSDGKIVVGGYSGGTKDFTLIRYNTNGKLDTSFDSDGIVTTPVDSRDDFGQSIAIQPNGKILLCGFFYNGSNNDLVIARYNNPSLLVGIESSEAKNNGFFLHQNYPNPFNPTTTINYSIPSVASDFSLSNVQIEVYDILGKEVTTLVNEQQSPGNYKVEFDASKLTSGIYFYKIMAGDFVETKKMLLLR